MELDQIEHKIACGEMNAAQVFTQQKPQRFGKAPELWSVNLKNYLSKLNKYNLAINGCLQSDFHGFVMFHLH